MRARALLLATALLPGLAQAHAFLQRAKPAVGASVPSPPKQLRLWYSENLEASFCRVTVTDKAGHSVIAGSLHAAPDDSRELLVPLIKLAPGQYRVRWKAVSVDTHVTHGSFEFKVHK